MEQLLDAIADVVRLISPEKVQAIALRIRQTDLDGALTALSGVVGTPAAVSVVARLVAGWRSTAVSATELASMLLVASHVRGQAAAEQSTEFVWTGPTTPFVSARRTEQALLQVINAAERTLFITSFVTYRVASIVKSMNAAADRGVDVSVLLELSQEHGGVVSIDGIATMRAQVPAARLYAWRDKSSLYSGGRVHAKVAVADGKMSFITSANLTGYAMEKNMEAGVLIIGGGLPERLEAHLRSLTETKVLERV